MAITVADIQAKISATGAEQVVSEANKAKGASDSLTKSTGINYEKMTRAGQKLTLGVTLPLAGLGLASLNAASDQKEAFSALNAVYGEGTAEAQALTKAAYDAAGAVGLSATDYATAAVQLGVFGKNAGLTGGTLQDFSTNLIGAAADLGSFYNTNPSDVLTALKAGLTGETEPLRKFGIFLTEATVAQKALEMGLGDANGNLTEQEKILARNALIMEQVGDASGDFAKTSDGLANSQRILMAELSNLRAELGQYLLPIALKIVQALRKMLAGFGSLSPGMKKAIVIIGGVAAAIGPLLIAIGTIGPAVAAGAAIAGPAFALLLGPIGLVVAAIVGLGIAYKTNFLGFGDAVRAAAGYVQTFAGYMAKLGSIFAQAFGSGKPISELISQFPGPLQAAAKGVLLIVDAFGDLFAAFKSGGFSGLFKQLPEELAQIADGIKILVSEGLHALGDAIRSIDWGALIAGAADLAGRAITAMGDLAGKAVSWITDAAADLPWGDIIKGAGDLAVKAVKLYGSLYLETGKWIYETVTGIDWGSIIEGARDLAARAIVLAGNLASKAATWLSDAVDGIDWAKLIAGATDLAGRALTSMGNLGEKVLGWIADAVPSSDKWLDIISGAADLAVKAVKLYASLYIETAKWIADAIPGTDEWLGIIEGAAGLAGKAIEKAGDLGAAVAEWVGKVATAVNWSSIFEPVTGAFDAIGAAVQGVSDVIDTVKDGIGTGVQTIRDAFDALTDVVDTILGPIEAAVGKVNDAIGLLQQGLGFIGIGGGGDDSGGDSGGAGNGQSIADILAVKKAMEDANTAIATAQSTISSTLTNLRLDVTYTQQKFEDFSLTVATETLAAYTSLNDNVTGMETKLDDLVTSLGDAGTDGGADFKTNLDSGLSQSLASFGLIVNDGIGAKAGLFVLSLGAFGTAAGTSFRDNFVTEMAKALVAVQGYLDAIIAQVGGFVNSAGSAGYSVGSAIGDGLNRGINAWIGAIVATARRAVSDAINGARQEAGAHSPSTKMIELGSDMGEGSVIGLSKWNPALSAAARGLAQAGIDAFGGTLGPYASSGSLVSSRSSGAASGGNTFVVMTRSELADLFQAADVVSVLTTPEEVNAAWSS